MFDKLLEVVDLDFEFEDKAQARAAMFACRDLLINWNYAATDSDEYNNILSQIDAFLAARGRQAVA